MKVGIISDTHDHTENVLAAIEIFNDQQVDYVFHAGDFTTAFTATNFAQLKTARFRAVLGNMDGSGKKIKKAAAGFGGEICDLACQATIQNRHIYMIHKNDRLDEALALKQYDLVIYGHTHHPDIRWVDNTLLVNPGEATNRITGVAQMVILNLDDMNYQVFPL